MDFGPGKNISSEDYHATPERWRPQYVLERYKIMHGKYPIAPDNIPAEWSDGHRYVQILRNIGDGAKANDAACVQMAVEYILEHFIGSGSGYIRARLARRLKHAPLTDWQSRRLGDHFMKILVEGQKSHEFEEYVKLWRRFIREDHRAKVRELAAAKGGYISHVVELLDAWDQINFRPETPVTLTMILLGLNVSLLRLISIAALVLAILQTGPVRAAPDPPRIELQLPAAADAVGLAEQRIQQLEEAPATSLHVLAEAYQALGKALATEHRFDEAETALQRSLSLEEDDHGVYSEHLIPILQGLVTVYYQGARYSDAMEVLRRMQTIVHRIDGVYSLQQLPLVDGMILVSQAAGDMEAADQQRKFHYFVNSHNYGEEDPRLMPAITRLADWLRKTGQFDAALDMYDKSVRIIEANQGPDSPALVPVLQDIASVYYLHSVCCADEALIRVQQITEADPAADHGDRLAATLQLADMQAVMGKSRAAARQYRQAWQMLDGASAEQLFSEPGALGIEGWDHVVLAFRKAYRKLLNHPKLLNMVNPKDIREAIRESPESLQPVNYPHELIGNPIPLCFPQVLDLIEGSSKETLQEFTLDLAYDLSQFGQVMNIRRLGGNAPGALASYTQNTLKEIHYRPRMVDGETVATRDLRIHQVYSPYAVTVDDTTPLPYSKLAAFQGCEMLVVYHY